MIDPTKAMIIPANPIFFKRTEEDGKRWEGVCLTKKTTIAACMIERRKRTPAELYNK